MAISYNIYGNDGRGGDVDYGRPIATTAAPPYTVGPLAAPSDNAFAVRAFDTVSAIEEANTDARVRIVIDAAGNDVTMRPNAVVGLSARALPTGTCWVSWGYQAKGQGGPPVEFVVTLTSGGTSSTATVAYLPGVVGYGCTLSGLASDVTYTIAVQAVGASPTLVSPAATFSITYQVAPLSGVDSLVAIPTA